MIFFLLYVRLFRIILESKVTTNQLTTCRLSKRHFYHVFLVNMFLTNKMALAVVNTANIMTVTDFFCHIIFVNWVRKFFTSFIHISFASKVKCKFSQVIVIESAKCNVRRRDTKKNLRRSSHICVVVDVSEFCTFREMFTRRNERRRLSVPYSSNSNLHDWSLFWSFMTTWPGTLFKNYQKCLIWIF